MAKEKEEMKSIKIYDATYMPQRQLESDEIDGHIGDNQKWWFDSSHPDSFDLFDLDSLYNADYFGNDHVSSSTINNYVSIVKAVYESIMRKTINYNPQLKSVLEVGAGGGWFTKEFLDSNISITAIEGTRCGYEAMLKRGIPKEVIIRHDLRKDLHLEEKFDIVCCTEVAEHIETPFSSQLVKTIIDHSDLVWFSFEGPGPGAHYHHSNEQPEKFWINIFDFYDYGVVRVSSAMSNACENRGTHVFFNRKRFTNFSEDQTLDLQW